MDMVIIKRQDNIYWKLLQILIFWLILYYFNYLIWNPSTKKKVKWLTVMETIMKEHLMKVITKNDVSVKTLSLLRIIQW